MESPLALLSRLKCQLKDAVEKADVDLLSLVLQTVQDHLLLPSMTTRIISPSFLVNIADACVVLRARTLGQEAVDTFVQIYPRLPGTSPTSISVPHCRCLMALASLVALDVEQQALVGSAMEAKISEALMLLRRVCDTVMSPQVPKPAKERYYWLVYNCSILVWNLGQVANVPGHRKILAAPLQDTLKNLDEIGDASSLGNLQDWRSKIAAGLAQSLVDASRADEGQKLLQAVYDASGKSSVDIVKTAVRPAVMRVLMDLQMKSNPAVAAKFKADASSLIRSRLQWASQCMRSGAWKDAKTIEAEFSELHKILSADPVFQPKAAAAAAAPTSAISTAQSGKGGSGRTSPPPGAGGKRATSPTGGKGGQAAATVLATPDDWDSLSELCRTVSVMGTFGSSAAMTQAIEWISKISGPNSEFCGAMLSLLPKEKNVGEALLLGEETVHRHVQTLRRLDRVFQTAFGAKNVSAATRLLIEDTAMAVWNTGLLLLQPNLRHELHRSLIGACTALAQIKSTLTSLRSRMHFEVARCELQQEMLGRAIHHLDLALALSVADNDSNSRQYDRLRYRLRLRTSEDGPTTPLEQVLVMLDQAREAKSQSLRQSLLERVVTCVQTAKTTDSWICSDPEVFSELCQTASLLSPGPGGRGQSIIRVVSQAFQWLQEDFGGAVSESIVLSHFIFADVSRNFDVLLTGMSLAATKLPEHAAYLVWNGAVVWWNHHRPVIRKVFLSLDSSSADIPVSKEIAGLLLSFSTPPKLVVVAFPILLRVVLAQMTVLVARGQDKEALDFLASFRASSLFALCASTAKPSTAMRQLQSLEGHVLGRMNNAAAATSLVCLLGVFCWNRPTAAASQDLKRAMDLCLAKDALPKTEMVARAVGAVVAAASVPLALVALEVVKQALAALGHGLLPETAAARHPFYLCALHRLRAECLLLVVAANSDRFTEDTVSNLRQNILESLLSSATAFSTAGFEDRPDVEENADRFAAMVHVTGALFWNTLRKLNSFNDVVVDSFCTTLLPLLERFPESTATDGAWIAPLFASLSHPAMSVVSRAAALCRPDTASGQNVNMLWLCVLRAATSEGSSRLANAKSALARLAGRGPKVHAHAHIAALRNSPESAELHYDTLLAIRKIETSVADRLVFLADYAEIFYFRSFLDGRLLSVAGGSSASGPAEDKVQLLRDLVQGDVMLALRAVIGPGLWDVDEPDEIFLNASDGVSSSMSSSLRSSAASSMRKSIAGSSSSAAAPLKVPGQQSTANANTGEILCALIQLHATLARLANDLGSVRTENDLLSLCSLFLCLLVKNPPTTLPGWLHLPPQFVFEKLHPSALLHKPSLTYLMQQSQHLRTQVVASKIAPTFAIALTSASSSGAAGEAVAPMSTSERDLMQEFSSCQLMKRRLELAVALAHCPRDSKLVGAVLLREFIATVPRRKYSERKILCKAQWKLVEYLFYERIAESTGMPGFLVDCRRLLDEVEQFLVLEEQVDHEMDECRLAVLRLRQLLESPKDAIEYHMSLRMYRDRLEKLLMLFSNGIRRDAAPGDQRRRVLSELARVESLLTLTEKAHASTLQAHMLGIPASERVLQNYVLSTLSGGERAAMVDVVGGATRGICHANCVPEDPEACGWKFVCESLAGSGGAHLSGDQYVGVSAELQVQLALADARQWLAPKDGTHSLQHAFLAFNAISPSSGTELPLGLFNEYLTALGKVFGRVTIVSIVDVDYGPVRRFHVARLVYSPPAAQATAAAVAERLEIRFWMDEDAVQPADVLPLVSGIQPQQLLVVIGRESVQSSACLRDLETTASSPRGCIVRETSLGLHLGRFDALRKRTNPAKEWLLLSSLADPVQLGSVPVKVGVARAPMGGDEFVHWSVNPPAACRGMVAVAADAHQHWDRLFKQCAGWKVDWSQWDLVTDVVSREAVDDQLDEVHHRGCWAMATGVLGFVCLSADSKQQQQQQKHWTALFTEAGPLVENVVAKREGVMYGLPLLRIIPEVPVPEAAPAPGGGKKR